MQPINTTNKLKSMSPLEGSLFLSAQCKQNVIENFKINALFRKSKLKPINQQETLINSGHRQSANWLESISYVTESQTYQPKKIYDNQAGEETPDVRHRIHLLPLSSMINRNDGVKAHGSKQKRSGESKQDLHKTTSFHKQECFIQKMKALGELEKQTIGQKQAEMRHIWPKLNYKPMNQTFKKLKSINISEISSSKLHFEMKRKTLKPSLPRSFSQSTSLHIQKGSNCYIPCFLRSILHA